MGREQGREVEKGQGQGRRISKAALGHRESRARGPRLVGRGEVLCLQEKELRFEVTEGQRQLGKMPTLCMVGSGMKALGAVPRWQDFGGKGARRAGLWTTQESPAGRRVWSTN